MTVPHPIPYQGSKRKLASDILVHFPNQLNTLYEPFSGSAALTLSAAYFHKAKNYCISDCLSPLIEIWQMILKHPDELAKQYHEIWYQQLGNEKEFYAQIRNEYNRDHEPAKLLYLIARCVKNSIRFNSSGDFNQSPDNRRKGMHPDKMKHNILGAHHLLKDSTKAVSADYSEMLDKAKSGDLVYMDPPYQGVSNKRDPRYYEQLDFDKFVNELDKLNKKNVDYIVSFDGSCGNKVYGSDLPKYLELTKIDVIAGRSSQATLNGSDDITIESLYLSRNIAPKAKSKQLKLFELSAV
ncbi:MAG: DNA adenine methylase [Candidatus Sericytochromatia bacterium]|nr:DNA adenine methylase [Candidatus Sericytochromatia bacterium]